MMQTRPQPLTYVFYCDSPQAVRILEIRLAELERALGALRITGRSSSDEMTRLDSIQQLVKSAV